MLLKHVYMGWKFQRTLKLDISFSSNLHTSCVSAFNHQNNVLYGLHQKTSVELLTKVQIFFHKKLKEIIQLKLIFWTYFQYFQWKMLLVYVEPSMSMVLGMRFILDSLWQFITKCDRCYYKKRQQFYDKIRQKFITKCVRFFITKCDSYYKIRVLLQIAAVQIFFKSNSEIEVSLESPIS